VTRPHHRRRVGRVAGGRRSACSGAAVPQTADRSGAAVPGAQRNSPRPRRPFRHGRRTVPHGKAEQRGTAGRALPCSASIRPAWPSGSGSNRKEPRPAPRVAGSGVVALPGNARRALPAGVLPVALPSPRSAPSSRPGRARHETHPPGAAPVPARAGRCRYRLAPPLPAPAVAVPVTPDRQRRAQTRRRTAYVRDLDTTGEHPPWRNMATSQTPNPSRRRPAVGDRAVSRAATPPGTDPTPGSIQHHPGHRHARGTSPIATPPPTPPEPEPAPPQPPRRRGSTTDRRTVIVQPRDFRLPDVLRHIEAGEIVLVMPQHNGPD
jgi:hypothetical protein